MRIAALDSYFKNRNQRLGRTALMQAVRRAYWGSGLLAWLYQRTVDTQWQRRERMPQFRPQPYEMFAKAHISRGEVDVAARLIEHKLWLYWGKRVRAVGVRWGAAAILLLAAAMILYSPLRDVSLDEAILWILIVIFPYVLFLLLWGLYGFGVGQKRALATPIVAALVVGLSTPMIIEGRSFWTQRYSRENDRPAEFVGSHFLYGLDKMLPVINSTMSLYPAKHHSGVEVQGQDSIHRHRADHPNRFAWLDMAWELLGWIIFAASAFTLSGFVRRDIER